MIEVIKAVRKANVLTHPSLPCLSKIYTINLTAGCPYECCYCYAQNFRNNPGKNKILFYSNNFKMLQRELPGKRIKPHAVYFSTSTEPFLPFPEILDMQFEIMHLLLKNKIKLLISTKSKIPPDFLYLFEEYKTLVHIQVGITTSNDEIRKDFEPNAASVEERLKNLYELNQRGINCEARLDPLIPLVTDTDLSLEKLFVSLVEAGTKRASASFVFIRPSNKSAFYRVLKKHVDPDEFSHLYSYKMENYCKDSRINLPLSHYRRDRINKIRELGKKYNIEMHFCSCKNPDIKSDFCHPEEFIFFRPNQDSLF